MKYNVIKMYEPQKYRYFIQMMMSLGLILYVFFLRPSVPVQFQYFLPAYSSSYPLTHTYTPISSSVSTIRQYPGKHH